MMFDIEVFDNTDFDAMMDGPPIITGESSAFYLTSVCKNLVSEAAINAGTEMVEFHGMYSDDGITGPMTADARFKDGSFLSIVATERV